jgi:hypothetical protein
MSVTPRQPVATQGGEPSKAGGWTGQAGDESHDGSRGARARDAAVLLPVLGLFLLMPPMITLFVGDAGETGIPRVVTYLFGVWLALIVAAAWLARRLRSRGHGPTP